MWLSPPTPFRSGLAWRFSRVFFENRSAKTICSSSIILTDPLGVVLGMPSDVAVATHAIQIGIGLEVFARLLRKQIGKDNMLIVNYLNRPLGCRIGHAIG